MKFRSIPHTDLSVSLIGLGTMTWGEQNTEAEGHEQMDYALERGVNLFDTAEMYPVPPMAGTCHETERIIGMEPQETQDFLEDLLQTAIRPEFHFVHEWQVGDMLIIDNRSAMHKAGFDFDRSQHRHLRRILVRGDRPS